MLRLSPGQGVRLPAPIPFVDVPLDAGRDIAVVGFPAEDPIGSGSIAAARRLFGGIYGVKRFSPGQDRGRCRTAPGPSAHDATTLGGSSGSVVIDLETGGALGVHFAGALERANYAVRGSYVLDAIAAATPLVVVPAMPVGAAVGVEPRPLMPEATGYETRDGYRADFLGADQPEAPLPDGRACRRCARGDVAGAGAQGDAVSTLLGRDEHEPPDVLPERGQHRWRLEHGHLRRRDWRFDPRFPEAAQLSGRSMATRRASVAAT